MTRSIVKKDLKRNRMINIILVLFMSLSAFLISIATITTIQLFQSIDEMYEVAQPPHFMQMHVGDIDQSEIDQFAQSRTDVQAWQTVKMLNIFSGDIWVSPVGETSYSLSDSLLDMGFVKQNSSFDYLLDTHNNILQVSPGFIGIPIMLRDLYDIAIGDTITIKTADYSMVFIVSDFIRDAQMNSALVSSTRFLISDEDFALLDTEVTTTEYLIQFLLDDPSQASAFQSAYEKAGLPASGQGITYAIIRLLSGFSGIVMATIFVMVSIALMMIVFLCLKFTILAVIEEDVASIGTMKAIGMSHKDIKQVYLLKYRLLSIIGCVLGYGLALLTSRYFTAHITKTFGRPSISVLSVLLPVIAVLMVYLIEVFFAKRAMKKLKKITVIDAIVRRGNKDHKHLSKLIKRMSLHRVKRFPLNGFMSIRQLLSRASSWSVMMIMIIIATIIMLVPLNILNTLKSPDFVTYMGQSKNDIVLLVTSLDNITERHDVIKAIIEEDSDVLNYSLEARIKYYVLNTDGDWDFMLVDHSSTNTSDMQYLKGQAPNDDNEIALSFLNANALNVDVGETLSMTIDGVIVSITVSGIYQDVTSGGYTAKMVRPFTHDHVERYAFYVNLNEMVNVEDKVEHYSALIGTDVKVTDMKEFVNQTFGDVITQTSRTLYAVSILVIALVAFITLMFMKLQTVKDFSQIAIMKSLGFTSLDLRLQYVFKMGIIAITSILIGTLLANTLGDVLVSQLLRLVGTGLSSITFIINPIEAYLIVPSTMMIIVLVLTWVSSKAFNHYRIIDMIVE